MNHLAHEISPYLLQHAHQPVLWFPWGKEAFEKATEEDKPIFLSIGYATCHWCHVMAHESFDDQNIAKVLNQNFISIKVDREERPDVDHVYMTAVSAMTGLGGWPLNVFLTPQGKPFYGGTYFPPTARQGMTSFHDILVTIAQAWHNNRSSLISSSDHVIQSIQIHMEGGSFSVGGDQASPLDMVSQHISVPDEKNPEAKVLHVLQRAYQDMVAQEDQEHGGWGTQPKFPMGQVLWFLMRYDHLTKEPQALQMVAHALTAMARGGIVDHLAGGFHRYSVDARWHVPHFEKMLYDQAILLRAYAEGYQLTGSKLFYDTARDIAGYVLREMTDHLGGFYTAQDADSLDRQGHLREGAFYVFSYQEIVDILGEPLASVFQQAYGVSAEGNVREDPHGDFVGMNVLYCAQDHEGHEDELARARELLVKARGRRPRPLCDDKILTDLNGLMIGALAFSGQVLGEPSYINAARQCADFITGNLVKEGKLRHCFRLGQTAQRATLDDYAYLADGLISLYEATFHPPYLEQAKRWMDIIIADFKDPQGGFFMTPADLQDLPLRPKDFSDGAIPCGNSIVAMALVRLGAMIGEHRYLEEFKSLFQAFFGRLEKHPSSLLGLWCAWMHHYHGGEQVCFQVGASFLEGALRQSGEALPLDGTSQTTSVKSLDKGGVFAGCLGGEADIHDCEFAKMRKMLYKEFRPFMVVKAKAVETKLGVHVCRRQVCHPPVVKAQDLERLFAI